MFSLFFFKQKTAYEMRISDWSSDVCSSDLQCRWQARAPSPSLPVCAISSLGKPSVEIERLQPLPLVIQFWGQVFERRGEHNCLYGALLVQRNLCFVPGRDPGCVKHLRPTMTRAIEVPLNAKLCLHHLGIRPLSRTTIGFLMASFINI